ncbi:MAG: Hsp20/alpha crystallin family protein [Planctomycetota bacterium]|jgi:HSP20 family protein
MNLVPRNKRDSWGLAPRGFFGDFDRIFDRFFRSPWLLVDEVQPEVRGWIPSLDVTEEDGSYLVRAEIPGVEEKDLNISIHKNVLSISGEKKEESEKKEEGYYHVERRFGSFHRDIPLPAEIDEGRVEAEYANGVLSVRLPKSEEEKPKRIDLK